ncbi:MAG: hypothetical protein LC104_18205 [Bacteroidales bacterium]|nr:hypothetical protein [Bacteroidales bacterium]
MRSCLFGLAVLTVAAVTGCGSDGTIPVKGSVQLDGKPLDKALVTLIPDTGTPGAGGFGATDDAGNFEIMTPQGNKGIFPGKYKVTVSKTALKKEVTKAETGETGLTDSDLNELVPPPYFNPETTTLNVTVEADKPVDLKITTPPGFKKRR